jgi:CheY-like chemotaxis protein
MPCLIVSTLSGCAKLRDMPPEVAGHLHLIPRVLLLTENASAKEVEQSLEMGATDIMRLPLNSERLAEVLLRAGEAAALQRDLYNMTREIFLEREILEHKTATLSFLLSFLNRVADRHTESAILRTAYTGLCSLLPVLSLHAALVSRTDDGRKSLEFFLSTPAGNPTDLLWQERLYESAVRHCPGDEFRQSVVRLNLGRRSSYPAPSDGHILTLPLTAGKTPLGVLLLLTGMERSLGRDQTLALDAAMRHLALVLDKARRFASVKQSSDRGSRMDQRANNCFRTALA